MKIPAVKPIIYAGGQAAVVFLVAHWLGAVWAAVLVIAAELYRLQRPWSLAGSWQASPYWLAGLSAAVLAAVSPRVASAIGWSVAYGVWLWWLGRPPSTKPSRGLLVAAVSQFAALVSLFLAVAFWHWPTIIVLVITWVSAYAVADHFLADRDERARPVLAAAWALVASECAWIFAAWLVNYILFGGLVILPQAAIVLVALGYCFGGIYISHLTGKLSRARLVEYLMIGLALLVIVIAGTKWNGVI